MPADTPPSLTTMLAGGGDPAGNARALTAVYDELRDLARARMAQERSGHTLQATALVHEVFVRLSGGPMPWQSRAHFFACAAEAMRRILIEHARARSAQKRGGGGRAALSIDGVADLAAIDHPEKAAGMVALDEAILRMEGVDAQAASIVRLRFFAGLSLEQTAEVLGVSERTAKRDWAFARAWLAETLSRDA